MAKTKKFGSKLVTSRRARTARALFLHHRHNFTLAHHRHTSYPILMLLLVFAAVFSWYTLPHVLGDTYAVHAVIQAPPLPAAATILHPLEHAIFRTAMTTVSGVCPPNSYVKLSNNGIFTGAALCQADGSWSLLITLQNGSNSLKAQSYNVTDQPGPPSSTVDVYFMPSAASTSPAAIKPSQPLQIGSNFSYRGYPMGQLSDWPLTISGGTAPYAVQIDWGDGETDLKSVSSAGSFSLQHSYQRTSGLHGSYNITVTATDADGNHSQISLFTIITPTGTSSYTNGAIGMPNGSATNPKTSIQKFWQAVVPTLGISLVALAGFWIGEASKLGFLHDHAMLKLLHLPHLFK